MNVARSVVLIVLSVSMTGCLAPQHPWSRQKVCSIRKLPDATIDNYEAWIDLLIRGYDSRTHRATSPAVDCGGAQVKWEAPAFGCTDVPAARTLLPDRPLTEADVIVNQFPDAPDIKLVWVITNRFASGDALGPAAVVEVRRDDVVVRAIGPLRANLQRVKLQLRPLGTTEVLTAEGEQCVTKDPGSCTRGIRILPYKGDRFVPELIQGPNGACLQAAWFYLLREESSKLDEGWRRRFRLTASIDFQPQALAVQEQLTVEDLDPKSGNPPQLFRKAHSDEMVRYDKGRFVGEKTPLWTRMKAVEEE